MTTKKIHYSSDEAATYKTGLSGWVSSSGHFFGENEELARYNGCTHKDCEKCGKEMRRNSYCEPCHAKGRQKKFDEFPRMPWEGKFPIYAFDTDGQGYFFDLESVFDYCYEHKITLEDLRLCFCYEVKFREIEADFWCDELGEDGEMPAEVEEALEKFNLILRNSKSNFFYGKDVAVDMSTFPELPPSITNAE